MRKYEKFLSRTREFILQDSYVASFLRLGLFSKEMTQYLRRIGIKTNLKLSRIFFSLPIHSISEKIGGVRFTVVYGLGHKVRGMKQKRKYPGVNVYFTDQKIGGIGRLVYEMLDSPSPPVRVRILYILYQEGGMASLNDIKKSLNTYTPKRYFRDLLDLGLVNVHESFLELSERSKKLFSEEVRNIWEKLKDWEFRVDVW